jgi:predicted outer membrane lipoprotein
MDVAETKPAPTNELAPVSIMVAVFAFVIALIPWIGAYFAWIPGIVAIAFAIVGLITAHRHNGVRRRTAVIGLVLAIAAIAWSFAGWFALLVIASFAEH